MMWISILVIVLIIAAAGWLFFPRRKSLSGTAKSRILGEWQHATSLSEPNLQLLEADKVLDHLLGELGYSGPLGEKLKKAERIIPNLNAVWSAHKLRNRIAHETGIALHPKEADRAMKAFEGVIQKFIK